MVQSRLHRWRKALIGVAFLSVLSIFSPVFPSVLLAADEVPASVPGELLLEWREVAPIPPPGVRPEQGPSRGTQDLPESLAQDRSSAVWQETATALQQAAGVQVLDVQPEYRLARLQVRPGTEATEIERLSALPWVSYAQPNYIADAAAFSTADAAAAPPALYPNDPSFDLQWNMRQVRGPEAWAITQGSYSIVVAAIDSGVDTGHPEFQGRLLPGYDYVEGDYIPNDAFGHGTHVAGIIAGNANNGLGITGLAPNVKVLPLRVLDQTGDGTYYNIATAIRRATDSQVEIVNLSLGGCTADNFLRDAVSYATGQGVLVVAAAGNWAQSPPPGCSGPNPDVYPAAYNDVLAVGADDHFERWAVYSGYKPYLSLAAPGGTSADAIYSTIPGGYGYFYGTSVSVPQVSAAAALVWTMRPTISGLQVAGILEYTADKVGTNPATGQPLPYIGGRNDYFGFGRLNVARAARWAYPPGLSAPGGTILFSGSGGPGQTRSVPLTNPSEDPVQWRATVLHGATWLRLVASSGMATYSAPGTLTMTAGPKPGGVWPAPGVYDDTVRVESVSPGGLPLVDIPVRLVVAQLQRRMFLPLVSGSTGNTWLDPLAPGVISGHGLYLENNSLATESLPFAVSFFGEAYFSLSISDNGLVLFGQPQFGSALPPTSCAHSGAAPNNAIYVYASDWRPDLGAAIYVHQPDLDTVVVTWQGMRRTSSEEPSTFQLVLPRFGVPWAHYLSAPAADVVVGAENWDGTAAVEVACPAFGATNASGHAPASGSSIKFDVSLPW